jgi:hypothetical protein
LIPGLLKSSKIPFLYLNEEVLGPTRLPLGRDSVGVAGDELQAAVRLVADGEKDVDIKYQLTSSSVTDP